MTESEAKKEIEHNVFCNTDNFEMTISKECYKTIINALNKQIARKPTKDKYIPEEDFCPMCGTEVTNCNYCPYCGQKIDWNE